MTPNKIPTADILRDHTDYRECVWCRISMSVRVVMWHEKRCEANPDVAKKPQLLKPFSSLGKKFAQKKPVLVRTGAPPLNLVDVRDEVFERDYELFKEDALRLLERKILVRIKNSLVRFRVSDFLLPHEVRELEKAVREARRAIGDRS